MSKTTASKVAVRAMKNLKIATLMKVDGSHQKIQNRKKKTDWIAKTLENRRMYCNLSSWTWTLIAHNNMLNREEHCVMRQVIFNFLKKLLL